LLSVAKLCTELIELLRAGRGYDLFRLSLYEAAALGASMSVPYGAWMGSEVEDSFWPPHELCVEIQSFLAEHEDLFSTRTWSEVAVVYSVESNFQLVARRDQFVDNRLNVSGEVAIPFWQVCEALSAAAQPYDVVFFPEGQLRPDTLAPADLVRYRTLVLPDCRYLTPAQRALVDHYERAGGAVVRIAAGESFALGDLPDAPQVRGASGGVEIALNVMRIDGGAALHLVNYAYDPAADAVPTIDELTLELRLPVKAETAEALSPCGSPTVALRRSGQVHRLTIRDAPLYTVVRLGQER
jgi:hypothetical protein